MECVVVCGGSCFLRGDERKVVCLFVFEEGYWIFFFQAEDGIRGLVRSLGSGMCIRDRPISKAQVPSRAPSRAELRVPRSPQER